MMAASMGPNFSGHPAAMAHQAVAAGHPMGPGIPTNPAQQAAHGAAMPQQFAAGHMAVAGPGAQVNPALMGAMPAGANPHAHALQHLSPAQQQLFQQQQHQHQLQNQCMSTLLMQTAIALDSLALDLHSHRHHVQPLAALPLLC